MIRMLRDWGAAVFVGLAVFLLVDWISKGADRTGDPAPAFDLVSTAGGNVKLADYAGKTVVLNFWGTWCGPCKAEIPTIAEWSAAHPEVPILGLADEESGSGAALAAASKHLGVTWPVLEATDATLHAYDVHSVPHFVVVAPDGTIAAVHRGQVNERLLDQLVASAD